MAEGTKFLGVYKCNQCGNIVEVFHDGAGALVCCGEPMDLLDEKIQDEGQEKHVPIIKKAENGYSVKVGSIEHPMEDNHYIEWIELIVDGELVERKHLSPDMKPEAEFCVSGNHQDVKVRQYCNTHGLWKA